MKKICKIIKVVTCELLGHSNILVGDFGYMHCARCDAFLGDSLGGAYTNDKCVIVGHECEHCLKNWKELTWRDKLLSPSRKRCFPSQTKGGKE